MNEQISLLGFEPEYFREEQYINALLPELKAAVAQQNIDSNLISVNYGKSYASALLSSFTLFRLHLRGRKDWVAVSTLFVNLIPAAMPQERLSSEAGYRRILINDQNPLDELKNFLLCITSESGTRYPTEWDCCSRYMECSDAKGCVHPDRAMALNCRYRKILKSGRIFYGENRNIE